MRSTLIEVAGLTVRLKHRYPYVQYMCRGYLALQNVNVDIEVEASDEDIRQEEADTLSVHGRSFDPGYIESVCLYRNLCSQLPLRDAFLLHAAVISDGEVAYAFSAPSGTGKSTHISQWKKAFGSCITVVNGDKPIIRRSSGEWLACGTPWCGKEGLQTNIKVPLQSICFLERGQKNSIVRLSVNEAASRVMHQVIIPHEPNEVIAMLGLLDAIIKDVPVWLLHCDISEDSARIARAAMRAEK